MTFFEKLSISQASARKVPRGWGIAFWLTTGDIELISNPNESATMKQSSLRTIQTGVLVFAFFVCVMGQANASTIMVAANHQGWVASNGYGNGGVKDNNVSTGYAFFFGSYAEGRSWGGFDLSSLNETVVSATLRIDTGAAYNQNPQGLALYDVSSPLSSFVNDNDFMPTHTALYNDLGTGNVYGTAVIAPLLHTYMITLNSQAIADINAASGGEFLLGFTNTTGDGIFSDGNDHRTLILGTTPTLAVPEPSTLALGGIGLAISAIRRRRTRSFQNQS